MPELTLDEELFLLTRDEDSGKDQTSWGVDGPLAKEHRKGRSGAPSRSCARGRWEAP